jgi:hypothetical protein
MTIQLTHKTVVTKDGPAAPAARGPLSAAWHHVRETIADMNYASRRVVELQAPWLADSNWFARQ